MVDSAVEYLKPTERGFAAALITKVQGSVRVEESLSRSFNCSIIISSDLFSFNDQQRGDLIETRGREEAEHSQQHT